MVLLVTDAQCRKIGALYEKVRRNRLKRKLRMGCSECGHWNRVSVNKVFIERNSPEPKVKVYIPLYELLEIAKCEKCGRLLQNLKN